jgi:hypothetical protein
MSEVINLISLCAKNDNIVKFVKKNITIKGTLINLSWGVSPFIFFIHPFPEAGDRVPQDYLTHSKKNTGNP